ncbi:hypothetical protein K432DRAFT_435891 [Lepidopterella palustris CBS 459.81]|uniref:Stress response protein ish1 n=1 Tax=Lepidopterella palustris CBS 459.81 TaxID=1314670 RepID=A0A8E2E7A9_9PEZI|nr:hypothetical protein K432DRAFT_435891 [Lepidopterella palustris CBS 459.81]
MRFSFVSALVVTLATESAVASTWFGKAAYNKWHETELERWLSDHDVPYPTPADRKDLENLVKSNWNDKVVTPYNSWDTKQLQSYMSSKGYQVQKGTEKNKDSLLSQVKNSWSDTEESVSNAYSNVHDWIFDSWTDSQLKAFCDSNGIPVPQPRTRDSLLKSARENYQSLAKKAGETTAYPGNWLYKSWSDSELKAWLDERGYPVPQPSTRDRLVAYVRRNSRLASLNMNAATSSAGNEYTQVINGVAAYSQWIKEKLGLAASSVSASASSAVFGSASSASSAASKSAQKGGDAATESATQGKNRVQEGAQKATDYVKEEL